MDTSPQTAICHMSDIIYSRYLELAKLCSRVYVGPVDQHHCTYNNVGMIGQKIIHGSFGRGYCRIFWNNDSVIFAFRGTREGIDWLISDFAMFPEQLEYCGIGSENIKVHYGFQHALDFVDKTTKLVTMEAAKKHIYDSNLFNGRKIVITGHSLGGAIALIFAVRLRHIYPEYIKNNLLEIVTFGAPAVGFKSFEKFYDEFQNKTFRVINQKDIVTKMPPLFFSHVGQPILLQNGKLNESYDSNSFIKPFTDHKIGNYIKSLEILSK